MSNDEELTGFGEPTTTVTKQATISRRPLPGQKLRRTFKCGHCDSNDIEIIAWCHWDEDEQQFRFVEYHDDHCGTYYCNNCGDSYDNDDLQEIIL